MSLQNRFVHMFKTKHVLYIGLVVTRIVSILADQTIDGWDSDQLYPMDRLIHTILIQVTMSFMVFDIAKTC